MLRKTEDILIFKNINRKVLLNLGSEAIVLKMNRKI